MSTTIATRTVGHRTINGTVFAVVDCVEFRDGKYVAVNGMCNGQRNWAYAFTNKAKALARLGLEDGEDTSRLAEPWDATFVHGQTGQDESDDMLSAGQYVRELTHERNEEEGCEEYTALVSSDLKNWYLYRSFSAPFVR